MERGHEKAARSIALSATIMSGRSSRVRAVYVASLLTSPRQGVDEVEEPISGPNMAAAAVGEGRGKITSLPVKVLTTNPLPLPRAARGTGSSSPPILRASMGNSTVGLPRQTFHIVSGFRAVAVFATNTIILASNRRAVRLTMSFRRVQETIWQV